MKKVSTLYTDYCELLLDLDLFGTVLSAERPTKQHMKEMCFADYVRTHPLPTLEDVRYKISPLASSDFHVQDYNLLKLDNNEVIMDLTQEDLYNYESDSVVDVTPDIRAGFGDGLTDSSRHEKLERLGYLHNAVSDSLNLGDSFTVGNANSIEEMNLDFEENFPSDFEDGVESDSSSQEVSSMKGVLGNNFAGEEQQGYSAGAFAFNNGGSLESDSDEDSADKHFNDDDAYDGSLEFGSDEGEADMYCEDDDEDEYDMSEDDDIDSEDEDYYVDGSEDEYEDDDDDDDYCDISSESDDDDFAHHAGDTDVATQQNSGVSDFEMGSTLSYDDDEDDEDDDYEDESVFLVSDDDSESEDISSEDIEDESLYFDDDDDESDDLQSDEEDDEDESIYLSDDDEDDDFAESHTSDNSKVEISITQPEPEQGVDAFDAYAEFDDYDDFDEPTHESDGDAFEDFDTHSDSGTEWGTAQEEHVEVEAKPTTTSQYSNMKTSHDFDDDDFGLTFLADNNKESKSSPAPEQKPIEKEEPKPQVEDEPKDLRQFLRKHPHSEVSFVLNYFPRKEVQNAITLGLVVKKGTKLHL